CFSRSWQIAARIDQLSKPGSYVTTEIGGEPIVLVRGHDGELRGFYNVCRHHAAAVMVEPEGQAQQLRCPYHGWTYSLAGELKGTPDFTGVCEFEREKKGLLPLEIAECENWVFVKLSNGPSLSDFLGSSLINQIPPLQLQNLYWTERRHYDF